MAENPDLITYGASFFAILAGLYGAIQAWRNKQKLHQLEFEKLIPKINIDFDHSLMSKNNQKFLQGKMTFENTGATNIKIVKLNIDGKDRINEFNDAYIPNFNGDSFKELENKIDSINIVGFNNSKQLNLEVPKDKYFRFFKESGIYSRKTGEEQGKVREINISTNISSFIEQVQTKTKQFFENIEDPSTQKQLSRYMFQDLLVKEIRGLQLFPGEKLSQQFLMSYEGSGVIVLNVELSMVRMMQKSVSLGEEFKEVADFITNEIKSLEGVNEEKFVSLLSKSLTPASNEIIDQRKTFLIYLQ